MSLVELSRVNHVMKVIKLYITESFAKVDMYWYMYILVLHNLNINSLFCKIAGNSNVQT